MKLWHVAALLLIFAGVAGWWGARAVPLGSQSDLLEDSSGHGRSAAGADPAPERAATLGAREASAEERSAQPANSPAGGENARGIQALRDGQLKEAVAAFELSLKLEPDERIFAQNLAEALARLARREREEDLSLADALGHLERAHELAPDRADILALLERWRSEASVESEFSEFESHYFHLSFDGSRTELLDASQRFLDRLEAGYTDLREWFDHDPILEGRAPFAVRLYRRDEFAAVTGLGHWAAGAFDGTIRLPLEEDAVGSGQWGETLRHELVHAFVHEVGGRGVPGWLHEGLAQWFEGTPGPRVRNARARLVGKDPIALADLERPLIASTDRARVQQSYDQALVLVDWIQREYGDSVLLAVLRGYSAGRVAAQSFVEVTGVQLDYVVEDALAHH